jgi:histidyl-tRNA synthetase
VAGGGRYDGLVKSLGGPDTPATGFAVGFDRLAELVALSGRTFGRQPTLYIAALGQDCQALAFSWVTALAEEGITAEMDFDDRSLKSQMKRADRSGATYVLIVGENERSNGVGVLRDMRTKAQVDIPLDDPLAHLRRILLV